jgi:hypothetical protein
MEAEEPSEMTGLLSYDGIITTFENVRNDYWPVSRYLEEMKEHIEDMAARRKPCSKRFMMRYSEFVQEAKKLKAMWNYANDQFEKIGR